MPRNVRRMAEQEETAAENGKDQSILHDEQLQQAVS